MILAISLDLKEPAAHYPPLYECLKSFHGWMHYMDPTWFISTDKTPSEIVDLIKPYLGRTDRCFVVVVERYQGLLPPKAWDWFKKHKQ
jgi:hypothetical protein